MTTQLEMMNFNIAHSMLDRLTEQGLVFKDEQQRLLFGRTLTKALIGFQSDTDFLKTPETLATDLVRKMHPEYSTRWNVEVEETGIFFCRDLHEKGEPCHYEPLFQKLPEPSDSRYINPRDHPPGTRFLISRTPHSLQYIEVKVIEWSPSFTRVKLIALGQQTPEWKTLGLDWLEVEEVLTDLPIKPMVTIAK
jgi:hypothetical protein